MKSFIIHIFWKGITSCCIRHSWRGERSNSLLVPVPHHKIRRFSSHPHRLTLFKKNAKTNEKNVVILSKCSQFIYQVATRGISFLRSLITCQHKSQATMPSEWWPWVMYEWMNCWETRNDIWKLLLMVAVAIILIAVTVFTFSFLVLQLT